MIAISNIFKHRKIKWFSRNMSHDLGIYSVDEFRKILERARARADRNGHCFSMVAFNVVAKEAERKAHHDLLKVLEKRIRLTDVIGWLDDDRIGVYLFDVPAKNAEKFVQGVLEISQTKNTYHVYTYPYNHKIFQNFDTDGKSNCGVDCVDDKDSSISALFSCAEDTEPSDSDFKSEYNTAMSRTPAVKGVEIMLGLPIPFWKRMVDIGFAGIAIVILFPLFMLVGVAIKIVSPGPVFFKQTRVGYLGKTFVLWKFRTMHMNTDTSVHRGYLRDLMANGNPMTKLESNPQIIHFGGILRKSGIDELPQLINVIRGEMSLVGPRPPIPYEVENYCRWFHGRFDTLPGLTGLWQVSGKNKLSFKEMIRLDIQYRKRLSLFFDLWIILKTPSAIWKQIADKPKTNGRHNERILKGST